MAYDGSTALLSSPVGQRRQARWFRGRESLRLFEAAKPEQVPLDVLGGEQSGQDDWLETIWLKMIGSRRRARRDFSRRAPIS